MPTVRLAEPNARAVHSAAMAAVMRLVAVALQNAQ